MEIEMITKTLQVFLAIMLVFSATMSWAYNQELAASYQELFRPVSGAKAGKELHLIKPDAFMEDLKKGKRYVTIDVRTRAESFVYTMTLPDSMAIPVNHLFTAENLARLPKDKPIVVVCKSGTRATAAGTALRHIGFNNVYILKGGFKALSAYLDPKVANTPPQSEKK
jgi:rhodanese-related sulfurtransferase